MFIWQKFFHALHVENKISKIQFENHSSAYLYSGKEFGDRIGLRCYKVIIERRTERAVFGPQCSLVLANSDTREVTVPAVRLHIQQESSTFLIV